MDGLVNNGFQAEEMKVAFDAMDVAREGTIDVHEFIAAMLDQHTNDKRQEKFDLAIKYFDQDHDGWIDKKEIINLTGFEIKEIIEYIFD